MLDVLPGLPYYKSRSLLEKARDLLQATISTRHVVRFRAPFSKKL